jgi:hypothetical protein
VKTDGSFVAVRADGSQAESVDDIVSHEVKQLGVHILVCSVWYVTAVVPFAPAFTLEVAAVSLCGSGIGVALPEANIVAAHSQRCGCP